MTARNRPPSKTLVFTATYNERENVEEFTRSVLSLDPRFRLLIVDDSSPDGTGEILDRLHRMEPRLTVIHRPRKLGLGSAHKLAMLFAIRNGFDFLVTMDSDFSHDPADIPRLLAALDGEDFAIGSRHMRGGSSDYTGYRRAISAVANRMARLLLGIELHEFTTSFRAFRVRAIAGMDIGSITSQGYSFFLESVFLLARTGISVTEIPIHFRDRKAGRSKIPRFEILNGMRKLLALLALRLAGWRPGGPLPVSPARCPSCSSHYVLERQRPRGSATAPAAEEDDGALVSCLSCGGEGRG